MFWKEILSTIAVWIALYSYWKYIRSILNRETTPHVFSWWIWTITTWVAFFAQVEWGGGWWSAQGWVTFIICFVITFLAFSYGNIGSFSRIDWLSLFLSIVAIILWKITDNPLYAAIFATLADWIWYIPTFRKVWYKPESEPSTYYWLMNVKHWLSLISLSSYNLTTMIFSGMVISVNFWLLLIQSIRKNKIKTFSLKK